MPKDPTTKTSTVAPPPKKPPIVDTKIFPPKPPPDLPPNVRVSPPAQAIANLRIPDVSDEALIAAFKDKPLYVLDRVGWSKLKSPYRRRLENLINQDPALKKILDYVLPVYPPATPQPQPTTAPTGQAIPTVTAEKLTQQEPAIPIKENDITAQNAPKIQAWMNGIKPGFYKWLGEKKFDAATSQHMFTNSFLEYLAMYKGGLAGFYLSQGAHEMLYSALGPIGDALSSLHQKDLQRKVKWMKNPLNPNALYYYLNVLPEEKAFKLLFIPVKATWGILARGGAPLISKTTYRETGHRGYGQIKTGYFFSPTLKLGQAANAFADGLDKLTGIPTNDNDFRLDQSQPSPFDQYRQKKNHDFKEALNNLEQAKSGKRKTEIHEARIKLKNLLDEHDGFYRYFIDKKTGQLRNVSELSLRRRAAFISAGISRAIFGKILRNTARRLRQQHNDPITYLLSLIGGVIWDITAGFVLNAAKVLVTKVINAIPGLNTIRAQLTEFFTSNRYISTARMGGATLQSFGKALVSPTSFSSGYFGASAGGGLAHLLGLPVLPAQIIGGGLGYGLGAFYRTSLNMAMNSTSLNWIYHYNELLLKATDINLSVAEQNYWRSELEKNFLRVDARIANFRPGPFSNFANWLYNRPYVRIPINGFVIADLGVKFLGWSPWAYPSFIAGDWLWQTRGAWSSAIARWFPTTRLGLWIGDKIISAQTWVLKNFIVEQVGMLGNLPQWGIRPFWQGLQNFWSKIQPYATNVFNPGFFLGFNFIPLLTPALGGWAVLAGPVLGSAIWLGYSTIFKAIVGGGPGFISSFSSWGFAGWMIGSIIDLVLPGSQAWLTSLLTFGLPLAGSILTYFGLSFTSLLSGALGWIGTAIPALASATGFIASNLAIWATVTSIAAVAGLAIFTGFVIYSSFWVPLVEESQATPQSNNFSINSVCNKLPNNNYQCCSSFDITQPLFNRDNYLAHVFDLSASSLVVQLFDQETNEATVEKNTDAFRRLPGETQLALKYIPYQNFLTTPDYTAAYTVATTVSFDIPYSSKIDSFLSVPYDQRQNLFELMQQDTSVVSSMSPFFDILKKLAEEYGKTYHLIAEYKAQLKLMKEQKNLVDDLIPPIEDGKLDKALSVALGYDPCPDPNQPCPEEKQGLKTTVNRYLSTIELYLNQTNPNLDNFLASLEQEQESLKQQINLLPGIIGQMEEAQDKINSQEKADAILDAKFLSFASISPEEQEKIWAILKEYLPDIFNKNQTFYFIPKNTNYQVCLEAEFRGQAGQPQTVCSTISASQSFWAQTNFAKSCTTFTP